jgi:two-component system, NarL family, nitrate/nitrite response regulator NarL
VSGDWSKLLSPRECQLAVLVARGLSNKDIARELDVREGTVKIHLHAIYEQLGIHSGIKLMIALADRGGTKPD